LLAAPPTNSAVTDRFDARHGSNVTPAIAEEAPDGGGLDAAVGDASRSGALGDAEAVATDENRDADAVSAFRDLH
jgi:hypothetical protein